MMKVFVSQLFETVINYQWLLQLISPIVLLLAIFSILVKSASCSMLVGRDFRPILEFTIMFILKRNYLILLNPIEGKPVLKKLRATLPMSW
ncbi:hypothetical protein D3C73_1363350 [compost metagenome]